MMKRNRSVASAAATLGVGCCIAFSGHLWADSSDRSSAFQKSSYAVENMTCAACPITVKKAMSRVDGVERIEINFERKIATVVYDPTRAKPQDIADASTSVGFPATAIQEPAQ